MQLVTGLGKHRISRAVIAAAVRGSGTENAMQTTCYERTKPLNKKPITRVIQKRM